MAQLEIEWTRLSDPTALPDCCARCGAAGTKLVPVPEKFAGGVEGLVLPLCPLHTEDWAAVGFRTRVGAAVILASMAIAATATWIFYPEFAGPNDRNETRRIATTISLSFIAVPPLGILMALWAKTPIRVTRRNGRLVSITGVCRDFAEAFWAMPPASLPPVADAARFEASDYKPARTCPPEVAGRLLAVTFVTAAVFGLLVGLIGLEFGRFTDGWDRDDWRFLALTAVVTVAYLVPLLKLSFVFSRFGLISLTFFVILALAGTLVVRLFGGPFRVGFGVIFCGGALLLLEMLVVHRFTWRWHVRSVLAAVMAAAGGPLILAGVVYLLAATDPGPQKVAYYLAPVMALICGLINYAVARTPFCMECGEWLVSRRIGALPRSANEISTALQRGEIVSLAGIQPYDDKAAIGDVELTVYSCPNCREQGTVVLDLQECIGGGKSGKEPVLKMLGRWQYPGPALVAIESMFPPPSEPSAELPDIETNT